MKRYALILSAFAFLSGCAGAPPLTAEQKTSLEAPVCVGANQCTVMWQRAQIWLTEHSSWKIQTANDVQLQTCGPGDSTDVAYTIIKEPIAQDTYQIKMSAACGNIFGCFPSSPQERIIQFNDYLRPPVATAQRRVVFGVQFIPLSSYELAKLPTPSTYGMKVMTVAANSLADRSGLRVMDVIVAIDGVKVSTQNDLGNAAQNWSKAKPGHLGIIRDGSSMELTVPSNDL